MTNRDIRRTAARMLCIVKKAILNERYLAKLGLYAAASEAVLEVHELRAAYHDYCEPHEGLSEHTAAVLRRLKRFQEHKRTQKRAAAGKSSEGCGCGA